MMMMYSEYGADSQPSKESAAVDLEGFEDHYLKNVVPLWFRRNCQDSSVTGRYRQGKNVFFHTISRMDVRPYSTSFSDYPASKVAGKVKLSDHLAPCRDEMKKIVFLDTHSGKLLQTGNFFFPSRYASVQKAHNYNTDRNHGYSSWDLPWFSSVPPEKLRDDNFTTG